MSMSANPAPLAVVMISYNEAHNIDAVLDNLDGFAAEVHLVDSFSTDDTVDRALARGVRVVQRPFRSFGDQWNFAATGLPIGQPYTMKLDPDERLTDELKQSIRDHIAAPERRAATVDIALWFMGAKIGPKLHLLRLWPTGTCTFPKVKVNEHAAVSVPVVPLAGVIEHRDSPNLHHWADKQNRYTTAEAAGFYEQSKLAAAPRLFGSSFERRMWLKQNFRRLPLRYSLLYLHHFFVMGAWKAGAAGRAWVRLRVEVFRMIEFKLAEMRALGAAYLPPPNPRGRPHPGATQVDDTDTLFPPQPGTPS